MPHRRPVEIRLAPDEKTVARFMSKIGVAGECWVWNGSKGTHGYGQFAAYTRPNRGAYGGSVTVLAHRASWVLFRGPIGDGMDVLHDCPDGDTPACVNPDHLWLGTHAQNMGDMSEKGRAKGCTRAKLNDVMARVVRFLVSRGVRHRKLADALGVRQQTISSVVRRITWKHA